MAKQDTITEREYFWATALEKAFEEAFFTVLQRDKASEAMCRTAWENSKAKNFVEENIHEN